MIEYERVIYSFFDWAGDIGGFTEFIYILCMLLVGSYAHRMYFAAVIQDMFRVRLDTHGAGIEDLAKAKTLRRKSVLAKRSMNSMSVDGNNVIAKAFLEKLKK